MIKLSEIMADRDELGNLQDFMRKCFYWLKQTHPGSSLINNDTSIHINFINSLQLKRKYPLGLTLYRDPYPIKIKNDGNIKLYSPAELVIFKYGKDEIKTVRCSTPGRLHNMIQLNYPDNSL